MASPDRYPTRALALLQALGARPERFDLFRVLRRLECAFRDRPRLGEALRAAEVPVRLGQDPSMAFAPAAIASFTAEGRAVPRLGVASFGVFGPNGPLPLHLTERARERLLHAHDPTLARFLDVFHHRLLELFYRASAEAEPAVARDRPAADAFATFVGALFGMGLPSTRARGRVSDLARLHHAGLLANQTRNAAGLERLVAGVFGVRARVDEFVGEWVEIPSRHRSHLGREPCALGQDAVLGGRRWLRSGRFRLVLGPMRRARFEALLPGSAGLERLVDLVRGYVGDELTWELRLVLDRSAWRAATLGAARLRWSSWVGARPATWTRAELVIGDPARCVRRRSTEGEHV